MWWKLEEGDRVCFLGIYGDLVKIDGNKAMIRLYDGAKILVLKYLVIKV